jgi:spore coat protein CotH
VYDPARVPELDILLPPDSIAALAADPTVYARGSLRYGDEQIDDIGVRLKGEYTFRPLDQKAAFKLKFDEFVPDQTFHGLRRMTLNNALEDPSFVSERLVYTTFRAASLPAPRANNALVAVNGEPYGVYVNIESEDKTFLRRWFGDDDGNLYEEQGVELTPGNEGGWDLETNEMANDRSDLIALIAALDAAGDDTLLADLAPILDTDRFLRYCALEGIVNQWDGYAYTQFGPNNFRLYHDPSTGKFSFLPWGMDMSLKPLNGQEGLDLLQSATGLILTRCLNAAPCRAEYVQVVRDMTDLFESLDLPAQADAMHAQIAALVADDPRKEVDTQTFEQVFAGVRAWLEARPGDVRAQLP